MPCRPATQRVPTSTAPAPHLQLILTPDNLTAGAVVFDAQGSDRHRQPAVPPASARLSPLSAYRVARAARPMRSRAAGLLPKPWSRRLSFTPAAPPGRAPENDSPRHMELKLPQHPEPLTLLVSRRQYPNERLIVLTTQGGLWPSVPGLE